MKHGSLFSGIGGFDLAAEWMGWDNVFQVEWDNYCQKVLAKNFPNVKRYGDIKEFKGEPGVVDIISGGFPCQPFSTAGQGKANQMTVISGLKCLELSEKLNRPLLLAKMLVASSVWRMAKHLKGYSLIWKMKGIKPNHLLFQLAVSGRGINEIESGLLHTPRAIHATMNIQVNPDHKRYRKNDLMEIIYQDVKMFPTPTANEDAAGKAGSNMQVMLGNHPEVRNRGSGTLNPNWVEWLMGYPIGWTDLKD